MEESLNVENHSKNPLINTIILKNAKKNIKETTRDEWEIVSRNKKV